jgi:uncharacterized membrane protein YqiK
LGWQDLVEASPAAATKKIEKAVIQLSPANKNKMEDVQPIAKIHVAKIGELGGESVGDVMPNANIHSAFKDGDFAVPLLLLAK